MVAGFDLVCEEDYTPPIKDFLREIMTAQITQKGDFPVILHAGESCERKNDNIYDALLLGTLRLGHGF